MNIKKRFRVVELLLILATLTDCTIFFVLLFNTTEYYLNFSKKLLLIVPAVIFLFLVVIFILVTNVERDIKHRTEQIQDNLDNIINGTYEDIVPYTGKTDDWHGRLCFKVEALRDMVVSDKKQKEKDEQFIKISIANISHDLKTPLSSIRGYAEGLLDNVADTEEKRANYTKMIINKVNTITSLLSELSYYSSIDTDGVLDVILPVNVKEYFDDCADEISQDLNTRNIEFIYKSRVSKDAVFCVDAEKISKAVKNIIGNSIKFVDYETGIITLRVEEIDGFIVTTIKDNGSGIEKDKLPHIFERYFKADSSRNGERSGSGIGLSIVKKIIEDHGGEIFADSVEGQGTQIGFKLRKYSGDIM